MKDAIEIWEDEGGSPARSAASGMTGTVHQIASAEQIKTQVTEEFDRVRAALVSAVNKQPEQSRKDTEAMIAILEHQRAEVMANEQAGYFVHDWQELRGQIARVDRWRSRR